MRYEMHCKGQIVINEGKGTHISLPPLACGEEPVDAHDDFFKMLLPLSSSNPGLLSHLAYHFRTSTRFSLHSILQGNKARRRARCSSLTLPNLAGRG